MGANEHGHKRKINVGQNSLISRGKKGIFLLTRCNKVIEK